MFLFILIIAINVSHVFVACYIPMNGMHIQSSLNFIETYIKLMLRSVPLVFFNIVPVTTAGVGVVLWLIFIFSNFCVQIGHARWK